MDDDDEWQQCNNTIAKLKLEQEYVELSSLTNECKKWIECLTGKHFQYENDFRKSLENGILLCELLNTLKSNCIKRINKHATPIAGIDNLNIFLKACQQHFHVAQTHLFNSTDLEDLSNRVIDSNSTDSIDEQNRRLKKVIHTIYWLSRKTHELGIQLPYYLDSSLSIQVSFFNNSNNTNNSTHTSFCSDSSSSQLLNSITTTTTTTTSDDVMSFYKSTNQQTHINHSNTNNHNHNNNHNNKLIRKDSVETLDSIGSSQSNSTKNSHQFLLISSQDDLDYQTNLTSPSSTSGVSSPSVLSYLSSYSSSTTSNTSSQVPASVIPTRYVDRRVSQPSQDPHKYNVNISEAGSKLARAAQEQLKIAEKLKESKLKQEQQVEHITNTNKTTMSSKQRSDSLNDTFDTPENWQHSVDDWKKRRKEKQKPPRCEENVHLASNTQKPLQISTSLNRTSTNLQSTSLVNFKLSDYSQPKPSQKSPSERNVDSQSLPLDKEVIKEDPEVVDVDYVHKEIQITRPFDHPTRGFGFLINKNANKKYAQIVVVEQDSLADRAGLQKNDQVVKINTTSIEDITNEQLRKIMRERLQLNSVNLNILRAVPKAHTQHQQEQEQQQQDVLSITEPESQSIKSSSIEMTIVTNQQQQPVSDVQHSSTSLLNKFQTQHIEYHKIVAPKPFVRKSLSSHSHDTQMSSSNTGLHLPKSQSQQQFDFNESQHHPQEYSAPPLPSSEPPSLVIDALAKAQVDPQAESITNALINNMKSVENWKYDQEKLMKQKYDEEQERMESQLRFNMDRIKDEEAKRREEEKLKLEKEKIRLQELELKQKEKQLQDKFISQQATTILNSSSNESNIKKNELNSVIEKIYDQVDEMDFLKYCEEQKQKIDSHLNKTLTALQAKKQETAPSSAGTIHDEIKRVQDSMDSLRTELLQRDMPLVTNDVNLLTQSLEITRTKQEEIDRIKQEQEILRLERGRIEDEKEKLKREAESLRQERELILLASTKKQQLLNQSQILEQFDGYPAAATTQEFTYMPMYKKQAPSQAQQQAQARKQFIHTLNQVPKPKYVSDLSQRPYAPYKQSLNNSTHWLIEEAERQRVAERQSLARQSAFAQQNQHLRKSTPNLLSQSMFMQPTSTSSQYDLNRNPQVYAPQIPLYRFCSSCNQELNQSSAMVIETLGLAFHVPCFRCSVCNVPLTNGKEGTEVRVRGTKLHCNNCFSNDKGLKLSAV